MAHPTIQQLAQDLATGRTTSRRLAEQALARIEDPKGEGARAFVKVYKAQALAAADASDALRKAGIVPSPLAGLPVSIKNLCNVAGETTLAGSTALDDAPPARHDAPVVARLRAAGAVIVGSTNMSEFAFSGVGANPHYGTPGNPADRKRVPGGSSSGAAVAVADDMCEISIGTDTGGSCRIPGALCGIVGYKPSRQRIPTDGAFPLSYSIDSIGPIARSVEACAKADALMAGDRFEPTDPAPLAGLRMGVVQGFPIENLDETVAKRFPQALDRLKRAGVRLTDETLSQLNGMRQVNSKGGVQP